jgi:hypothetical protein
MSQLSAYEVSTEGVIEAVEEWRPIPGLFDRYEVSSFGNIRNAITGKQRKLQDNGSGYYMICYKDANKKMKHLYAHRAVLSAFNPVEGWESLCVNHCDFDTHNNTVSNLIWVTKGQNIEYSRLRGRYLEANKKHSDWQRERMENGTNPFANLTRDSIRRRTETRMNRKANQAA